VKKTRITDLKVTPVAFPDPPLRNSWGVHGEYALRTILQICTDEGFTGVSETYGGEHTTLKEAKQSLIGEDPYSLERIKLKVPSPRTFAAIEVACLDLIGKAIERPVCDIIGGKVRDAVPYAAYLFFKYSDESGPFPEEVSTPDEMVEFTRFLVKRHGFKTLKLKAGVFPPKVEAETLKALREAFGEEYGLRIDPNGAWSVETSIRIIRRLRDLDPEYVEDPTDGIEGMARVRRSVNVPLSTNMCVTNFNHIPQAVRLHAVDVILSDHHYWGGLTATKRLAAICGAFNLGLSMHSNSHLGISLAAMTHVACSTPNLTYACDTHYPWNCHEEDIIQGGPFKFKDGCLEVPKGPGLGVEIDEEMLRKYAENYQKAKSKKRNDTAEMQKRRPEWLPLKPRW